MASPSKRLKATDSDAWPDEILVHFDGSAQPNPGL